ncbi:MAG: hypothetical protein RQM95_01110 [Syntrophaceticus schinkii]
MTYKSSTVETALLLLRELLTHPVVDKENNSGLLMRIQQDPEVWGPLAGGHGADFWCHTAESR